MIRIQKALLGTVAMVVLGILSIGTVNKEHMIDIIEKHNAA